MSFPSQVNEVNLKRRKVILLVVLGILVIGVFVVIFARRPIRRVVILPFPERTPSKLQVLVEKGWSWLRFHWLGPGKSVLLSATIIELENPGAIAETRWFTPECSSTNGLRVWILKGEELDRLRQWIKVTQGVKTVSNPRIQTASGIQGGMFVGQTVPVNGINQQAGLELKCLPKSREDSIELISTITFTELEGTNPPSTRTNLAVRSRIQIPNGSGVFLLNAGLDQIRARSFGILLTAKLR